MTSSSHDDLRELSGLYALDAIDPQDREIFERHLKECAECRAEVESLSQVRGWLGQTVPIRQPRPELRDRVLAAAGVAPARSARPSPEAVVAERPVLAWALAAAASIAAVALGWYALELRGTVSVLMARLDDATARAARLETQTADAMSEADEARQTVAVLVAPDLNDIRLAGQPAAPAARGRAFWSGSRGLLFTASGLPPLRAGRIYQLWYVAGAAPISAGLVAPDAAGTVTTVLPIPPELSSPVVLALTEEPEAGVPAPTGDRYLIGAPAAASGL